MKNKFIRFLKDNHAFNEFCIAIRDDFNEVFADYNGIEETLLEDGECFFWKDQPSVDWETLHTYWFRYAIEAKFAEIENRVREKWKKEHGISVSVGPQRRRGRKKDTKREAIEKCFGFNTKTLMGWRRGDQGAGRQRLFRLLYSLDLRILSDLSEIKLMGVNNDKHERYTKRTKA